MNLPSTRHHFSAGEPPPGERAARPPVTERLLAFVDRFIPAGSARDADAHRRGRLLVVSSLAFSFACFFFGVEMSLAGRYPLSNVGVTFLGGALALFNLPLLRASRSHVAPGFLLCLEISLLIAFQAYFDLGFRDPVLLWYFFVPWLAAFLIRPAASFVFAVLTVAIAGGFYALTVQGHVFPAYTEPERLWWIYFLQFAMIALIMSVVAWLYEGQTLGNLRLSNRRLRSARDALQESNRRIENILESINDGFFALDERGRFTYVNGRAEQLLGERRAALLGRCAQGMFSEHIGADKIGGLHEAAQEGATVEFEAFYEPLERWFAVHIYPFSEGLSVYFRDVTDRRAYEQGLIEAKEQAEELSQMKSTFLANMSHEIRTPLTGIIGFAGVLAEESHDELSEFATLIERSAQRLLNTLNSVLDYAQLESGSVTLRPETVDVAEEAEGVAQLLAPLARERGLYLRVERASAHTTAHLDKTFLNRVLNNLVGNAIKFTAEGGVTVEVEERERSVLVRVKDTGIGISEAFLPHLFEEFRQESTGLGRSHEGSGLGLAITHHLVEAMGAAIDVESEQGEGTVFTVSFPQHQRAEASYASPA